MIHAMRIIPLFDSWRNKFPSSYGLTIGYFWSLVLFFFPFSILQTCSIATFLSIKYSVPFVRRGEYLIQSCHDFRQRVMVLSWNEEKSIALVDIPWRGTSDLIIFLSIAVLPMLTRLLIDFYSYLNIENEKENNAILFRFSYRGGIGVSSSSSS